MDRSLWWRRSGYYLDRDFVVIHDSSLDPLSLTSAIISNAFHRSKDVAISERSNNSLKKAEALQARAAAEAKLTAAIAAAADRPNAESMETIRSSLRKDIISDLKKNWPLASQISFAENFCV